MGVRFSLRANKKYPHHVGIFYLFLEELKGGRATEHAQVAPRVARFPTSDMVREEGDSPEGTQAAAVIATRQSLQVCMTMSYKLD